MDSNAGEEMSRSFGETVRGERPGDVLRVNHLHVGECRPVGSGGLDESEGYSYLLIMIRAIFPGWSSPLRALRDSQLGTCSHVRVLSQSDGSFSAP